MKGGERIGEFGKCLLLPGLARHHIIPYAHWRDFWNRAINNADVRQKFRDFVIDMIKHSTLHSDTTDAPLTDDEIVMFSEFFVADVQQIELPVMAVPFLNLLVTMYSPFSRKRQIAERVKAVYVWQPFLWFHGYHSSNRADDRGEHFEINARPIVDRNYPSRFSELENLQGEIIRFNEYDDISAFDRAIAMARGMMTQRVSSDYDPFLVTDWEEVNPKGDLCQFKIIQFPTKLPKPPPKIELRKKRLSKVDDNYSCEQTARTFKRLFDNGSYYIENTNIDQHTVWNLTHFNLETMRQIIKDVVKVDFLQYPDWRSWFTDHYISPGHHFYEAKDREIQCVVFGDLSFAVGITEGNDDPSTSVSPSFEDGIRSTSYWRIATNYDKFPMILIVDRNGRPVMIRDISFEWGNPGSVLIYKNVRGYWHIFGEPKKVVDDYFACSPLSLVDFAPNLVTKYLSDEFSKKMK